MPFRRVLPFVLLPLLLAAGPLAADERARLEPVRVATPPAIDGRLDDEAWQNATLPHTEWLTYNPRNGDLLGSAIRERFYRELARR